jgi:hypothetical protein
MDAWKHFHSQVGQIKAFNNEVTTLFKDSITAYKLKPFVIWHRKNTRKVNNINKHNASVLKE